MLLSGLRQLVVVRGIVACSIALESRYGDGSVSLIDAMKMAATRGSFFSSRRLASKAGSVWRRVGPLGDLLRGAQKGEKSPLGWGVGWWEGLRGKQRGGS